MYSLAQLEARPRRLPATEATTAYVSNKQLLNSKKDETNKCQNKKTTSSSKLQKPVTKSVRITEPPKETKSSCAPVAASPFIAPPPVGVAIQATANSYVSSAVNRPRSVTDALFAAAPEVATTATAAAQPLPPSAPLVTTATDRKCLLPEDMNKGFLQFAEVDPELTSKYCWIWSGV